MRTAKHKSNSRGNSHDLYHNIEAIKKALQGATWDAKEKAAEVFSDSVETIKERASNVKDSVGDYTAEKPFKSLGIALLVGAAIGFLFRR